MHPRSITICAALASLFTACAPAREPIRIRLDQPTALAPKDLEGRPIIVELREGDVVPLEVVVEGGLVTSPPGASVPLKVTRPFFMRIDDKGIRLSLDGRDFDEKSRVPGSFSFGLGVTKEGAKAQLHIKTPQR